MTIRMDKLDIVIVGVGGQGTLMASRVLGNLAKDLGYDVKVSEVHGMSQRGGSVITYVRMGKKVYASLIEQGGADYVLAFEELEALRAVPYLKKDGTIIMNAQRILPMPVIIRAAEYPEGIVEKLGAMADVVVLDALPMAKQAGNERTVNTILLGALAARLPFAKEDWVRALNESTRSRFIKANLAAFELGYAE